MTEMMWSTDSAVTQWESNATSDGTDLVSFLFSTVAFPSSTVTEDDDSNGSNGSSIPMLVPGLAGIDLDLSVIERFRSNRRVNDTSFFCLIAAYCVLIVFGTLGNSLVVYVVVRQPAMRTARNVFVVNLAISDLLLCLITMPLTLMEIRSYTWPLGNSPVSCKMVGSLQAVSIFVSTLSITAIALDRYQLIVYPTKRSFQLTGAMLALAGIWTVGVVLALPLFIVRTLQHLDIPIVGSPVSYVDYCIEDWPSDKGRSLYSIGSILVQYALPIVTVSVAHARICNKLRFRMTSINQSQERSSRHQPQQQQQQQHLQTQQTTTATTRVTSNNGVRPMKESVVATVEGRKAVREEQLRKTNTLLVAIAIIFTICWLPMNTFNVVVDTWNVFGDDTETMLIVYAICHMVGMSSACANPLLYGWLNDNFRKEFQKIGASLSTRRKQMAIATANGGAATAAAASNRPAPSLRVVSSQRHDVTTLELVNEARIHHQGPSPTPSGGGISSVLATTPTATPAGGLSPQRAAITTAVTMIPSPAGTSLGHHQLEATAVTHLVTEPSSTVAHRVGENSSPTMECSSHPL